MLAEQLHRVTGPGFIAALDQSGGSTPKALKLYGIDETQYGSDEEMFNLVHDMRSRIITSPAFTGSSVLGTILFEQTMRRDIGGMGAAEYLWNERKIVPFVKIDKGLQDEVNGVQLMKPIPGLGDLLDESATHPVFGTKMRSVINAANPAGVTAIVEQQFQIAAEVGDKGLLPILEPEININIDDKAEAEGLLRDQLLNGLAHVAPERQVMIKLSIPTIDDFYQPLIEHPRVLRVVALSGGYDRAAACTLLAKQHGMIASFSRALTEGLTAQQTDDEFNGALADAIEEIAAASNT